MNTIPNVISQKWCIKKESRDKITALSRKYLVEEVF